MLLGFDWDFTAMLLECYSQHEHHCTTREQSSKGTIRQQARDVIGMRLGFYCEVVEMLLG